MDPSTHTVYVANERDDTVSVINEATNTVTATIAVGGRPGRGGGGPVHRHRLRGQLQRHGTVSVINGATNTVTTTIGVGTYPLRGGGGPVHATPSTWPTRQRHACR